GADAGGNWMRLILDLAIVRHEALPLRRDVLQLRERHVLAEADEFDFAETLAAHRRDGGTRTLLRLHWCDHGKPVGRRLLADLFGRHAELCPKGARERLVRGVAIVQREV